jgi:ParB/RepB/Spo0J family partition protein
MPETNQRKYRRILGELDQLGYVIHINRVCDKRYELQVNWQIVKQYRKRDSCNKFILKIHKKRTMSKEKKVAEIVEVPIHFILPDSNNPRANYSEESCIELAKSIKEHGLLQPIMVRPASGIEPLKYVVVYGHRRLWAAKFLKLETIPAQVKEMTEDEAFEFQIIENLQREDVNPMDESFAFQQLIKKGLSTPEMIADKIGKSPKYVYDRVILQQVIPALQAAVRIGQFTITHAKQFARVTPEDQIKLWAVISNKNSQEIDPAYIRRLINDTFKLKLGEAIFPTGDSQLVPAAGSCLKCKKHSGCRQLLFEDIQDDDVCFDIDCYKSKETAHIDRLIEKYKGEGKEVKLLSACYMTKDSLLVAEPNWRFQVMEKETNTVGIIVEIPAWQQDKLKIGDTIWLKDVVSKTESDNLVEGEDQEEEEIDEYEGLSPEETISKKKEIGVAIRPYDLAPLLSSKLLDKIIDSYKRGAFEVEAINQYLRMNILRQRLPTDTLKVVFNSLGWELKGNESESNYDTKSIEFLVQKYGDNTEKLLELLVLLDMSICTRNTYQEYGYNFLKNNYPDFAFDESLREVEELAGKKMYN